MVSFGAFAVGYFARPIGGIVLSHFGDRYGRRRVFLISLFVMSGATLGMGLVPAFATWGAAASVLMVTLRLVQGFCLGGELPGALTYVVETAPRHAPSVCGVVFSCVTMGVAVATGVSLAVRTWLPPDLVPTFGWRIAFVLGGLGGLVSFALRRSLEESPEFARMKQLAARQPFQEVVKHHLKPVAIGIFCACGDGWLHRPVLRAHGGVHVRRARLRSAPGRAVADDGRHRPRDRNSSRRPGCGPGEPAPSGARGRVDACGPCLALLLGAWPAARLSPTLLLVLAGACATLLNGTFAVLLTDLFPTRVRFSGVALGFNVAFTIFSGTAPLVATSLIRSTGSNVAPAFVMIAYALLTFVASFGLSRVGGHVLSRGPTA